MSSIIIPTLFEFSLFTVLVLGIIFEYKLVAFEEKAIDYIKKIIKK